jgi:hypothetical protein
MADVGRQIQRAMGCTVLVPGEPVSISSAIGPPQICPGGHPPLQLAFDLSLFLNPRQAANS